MNRTVQQRNWKVPFVPTEKEDIKYAMSLKTGKADQETTEDITAIKKEIISLCTQLGGTKNKTLMTTLKEFVPSGNPNAIKDVQKAKDCLAKIKEIQPVQA